MNRRIPTWLVLSLGFGLCLTFNWVGTYTSLRKTGLAPLLFTTERDTKALQDVMLQLRDKVYEGYDAMGSKNVLISIYRHASFPIEKQKVRVVLGGKPVLMPAFWIHELRACLLQHPYDETNAMRALQQMHASHSLNPHLFQYGGFFMYSLGAAYWLTAKLGLYHLTSDMRFYLSNPDAMAQLYAVGERFIGLVAALGIFPMFWLARRWRGERAALIAVLLLPFVPQFLEHAHRLKPHVFCLPFTLLAATFAYAAFGSPTRKNYFLAGLMAGFSIGTVYSTVFWVFVLAVGLITHAVQKQGEKGIGVAAVGGVVMGFLLFNPYYVLAPGEPWEELVTLMTTDMHPGQFFQKSLHFYASEIPAGMGWPLALLALSGIGIGLWQRRPGDKWMLMTTLVSSVITNIYRGDSYHAVSLFALLTLWAARALDDGFLALPRITGLALALLAPFIVLQQVLYASLFLQPHPGFAIGEWVQGHVPAGARILRLEVPAEQSRIPFRYWEFALDNRWLPGDVTQAALDDGFPGVDFRVGQAPADYVVFHSPNPMPSSFTVHGVRYVRVAQYGRHFALEGPLLRNRIMRLFRSDHYVYARQ